MNKKSNKSIDLRNLVQPKSLDSNVSIKKKIVRQSKPIDLRSFKEKSKIVKKDQDNGKDLVDHTKKIIEPIRNIVNNIPDNIQQGNKRLQNLLPIKKINLNIKTIKFRKLIKTIILITGTIFLGVVAVLLINYFYINKSKNVDTLIEGVVGQPQYINPILSFSNDINSVDKNIETLIYPSLFGIDKDGNLEKDIVLDYSILDSGKTYNIKLKTDVLWDDGQILNVDDIIYTINTIKNPEYKSSLELLLSGVIVEKVNEFELNLKLESSYSPFIYNLTFGILPEHVWSKYNPQEFVLAPENLKVVGSSKYKYFDHQVNKNGDIVSYNLVSNDLYKGSIPNIKKITFVFYGDDNKKVSDFNEGKINAFSDSSTDIIPDLDITSDIKSSELKLPQYYGMFFNLKDKLFEIPEIRKAINLSVNRDSIINNILNKKATKIVNPLTPYNKFSIEQVDPYNVDEARKVLDEANWKDIDGDGIREKDNIRAEFKVIIANGNKMDQIALELQRQLKEIGISMQYEILSFNEISNNYIKERKYQAILIGHTLNIYPDPYLYWHSSQSLFPGVNLSQYSSINTDGHLESARTNTDENVVRSSMIQFQQQLMEDNPAVFLYAPYFTYYTRLPIDNVDINIGNTTSDRFNSISNWTINNNKK